MGIEPGLLPGQAGRGPAAEEDQAGSSMAGQFDSVIGTTGIEEFEAGVHAVLSSRRRAGATGAPIAGLLLAALTLARLATAYVPRRQ